MQRIFIIFIFIITSYTIHSQSIRYWGTQFNSESSLLGDAVVGDNSGITSIYFNPAGIMEAENNQLSLSANLINISYEVYHNALGSNDDAKLIDYGFRVQPRFATFIYKPKDSAKFTYQFVILNRYNRDIFTYNEVSYETEMLKPGNSEKYQGAFSLTSEYSDYWGGIGMAYRISKNFIIGGSAFISVKNYLYSISSKTMVFPIFEKLNDTAKIYNAMWSMSQNQTSYDVRALGKIGFRYHYNNFKIGLNITLPSVHIYGNADVQKSLYQVGISDFDSTAPDFTYFETGKYRKLNFKDPFAVSLGFAIHSNSKKAIYYFTTEYFAGIKRYKMIDGTKVIPSEQDNYKPGSDVLSYYSETNSIINLAIGYQYKINEKLEILSGFKTDFDAAKKADSKTIFDEFTQFKEVPANIYHFNIGSKLNIMKSSFTIGFQFSYGQHNNLPQYANYTEVELYDPETRLGLQGERKNSMVYQYFDLGFYLGFLFGF